MTTRTRKPYKDPDSTTTKWVAIFVLLSLLLHAILFLTVIILSLVVPPPKLDTPPPPNPVVSLSMLPTPVSPPPQPRAFMPTAPDPNAKPNPNTPIESDNNSTLKSESKKARADSPLPDVTGQNKHTLDLTSTPLVQSKPQPAAPAAPAVKTEVPKPAPTPPQPKPSPETKPQKPTPDQTKPVPKPVPTPQVVKNQVDPDTGLPVLPPIDAPTLAPQSQVNPNQQPQKASPGAPPPSFQLNKSDIAGSAGAQGPNAAAANATALGKYKAKFYRAVGSRWYDKVAKQLQLLPIGLVRVQYTIYADGTVTTKVLDPGNSEMQMLLSISVLSIREAAPFDKFDDYPGLREELAKTQNGNSDSYTDDFSFSVYGQ